MIIQHSGYPVAISEQLVAIISDELEKSAVDTSAGFIINFRDPDYSADSGGYHPVEISVDAEGRIQYITDFAYVGQSYYAELDKELDFDFGYGVFQQNGREYPIQRGVSLFEIWQNNFCGYYQRHVYEVTIQSLA